MRAGPLKMHQFAQFLGRHHDLMRPAPSHDRNAFQIAAAQGIKRMRDNVRAGKFGLSLAQDPGNIERHIPHPNDHSMPTRKIRLQISKLWMPIIPAHETGAAKDIGQILTLHP